MANSENNQQVTNNDELKNNNSNETEVIVPSDDENKNKNNYKNKWSWLADKKINILTELDAINKNKLRSNDYKQPGAINSSDIALDFLFPNWGYDDFINERALWQKHVTTLGGEPGFFYFKIFFNFATNYGLFGGILKDFNGSKFKNINTANMYLKLAGPTHVYENCEGRRRALLKFVKSLSYISSQAPWFFSSIKNLNQAVWQPFNDLNKERIIEIGMMQDAIDMRIGALFDLYRFACFDQISYKEIIPENLRKFDMSIVLFTTPLRYFQTSFISKTKSVMDILGENDINIKPKEGGLTKNGANYLNQFLDKMSSDTIGVPYKSLEPLSHGFNNMMSFKMFTFQNCEIDISSIGDYYANDLKNDVPFKLGECSLKIRYDKVFQHRMDEWNQYLFGDTGFLYDLYGEDNFLKPIYQDTVNYQQKRLDGIKNSLINHNYSNKEIQPFKSIVDATEQLISAKMMYIQPNNALGNIYGNPDEYVEKYKANIEKLSRKRILGNLYGNLTDVNSDYYIENLKKLNKNLSESLFDNKKNKNVTKIQTEKNF